MRKAAIVGSTFAPREVVDRGGSPDQQTSGKKFLYCSTYASSCFGQILAIVEVANRAHCRFVDFDPRLIRNVGKLVRWHPTPLIPRN